MERSNQHRLQRHAAHSTAECRWTEAPDRQERTPHSIVRRGRNPQGDMGDWVIDEAE
jgi:hypothetical protein